jgi:anti-sigma factor RsiW
MTHALTCRELSEFVDDYVAGTLAPQKRALFEEHLTECPECHTYLWSWAATMRLLRDAHADLEPGGIPERLVRAILVARRA